MKTIKMKELLSMESIPNIIRYKGAMWRYIVYEEDYLKVGTEDYFLFDFNNVLSILDDEVEIIEEEKEIEKIRTMSINQGCVSSETGHMIVNTINELIDAVNELKRGNN